MKLKHIFIVLLFYGANFYVSAQESNSLKKYLHIVDSTKNGYTKLAFLDSISTYYHRQKDRKTSTQYDELFLEQALQLNEYDKAVESTLRISGYYHMVENNPEKNIEIIQRMLPFIDSLKRTRNQGGLFSKLGGAYFNGKNYTQAIDYYTKAINYYGVKDSIHTADAIFFKAQAYEELGYLLKATKKYHLSADYYEKLRDSSYMFYALNNIGAMYTKNGLYTEAKKVYAKNKEIAQKGKLIAVLSDITFKQAQIAKKEGNTAKQEALLLDNIRLQDSIKDIDPYWRFRIECDLATLYFTSGNTKMANTYLMRLQQQEAYATRTTYTQLYYISPFIYEAIAQKNYSKALQKARLKLQMAKQLNDVEELLDSEMLLSSINSKLNNTAQSDKHQANYYRLKDSLFSFQKTNTLLYYQTQFKTEQKEKEILVQENKITLLEKDKKNKQRLALISLLGLTILFTTLYLWRNRKSLLKEQKLQQDFTSQLLNYQEQEKKRVSENLHDGLGQSLLLIKNKVFLNNDKSTQELVDDVINEVNSISQALHPFQLEKLGLTQAIKSVIDLANDNSDIFISSEINDINDLFSKDQELNIYRTIQESLNNVIKHSKAEASRIEVTKKPQHILIKIKDNGVGFDFSEEYTKIGSLGLKTLKERIRFLNGSISFSSEKNKGTDLQISIPI